MNLGETGRKKLLTLSSYAPYRKAAEATTFNLRIRIQSPTGIEAEPVRFGTIIRHTRPIEPVVAYATRATIPVAPIYEIGRSVLDITSSASSEALCVY